MLTYLEWHRLHTSYYRSALEYFYSMLKKDNEDIVLIDIEFKSNDIRITYENVETGFGYYKDVKIEDFIDFHKENLNKE